ncbi:extracellular solute-binding protein [Mesorhizobium sp.]|uniref:extracellular solute-binding protein n=1 Tax=Mesorhizobium sp. TaxID=1871066 RepID=UPI000FE3D27A|nr:extracellular solute-binding protein [Mesorhizobium sp.]RWQ22717.1 MAG: extracellular solute-binding protein [Mesorhizobium sp.]
MKSLTRRNALIGAGAAATYFLTGPSIRAQEKVTLRVTAAPSIVADMYRLMGEAFMAKHPDIAVAIDSTQRDYNALLDATLRDALTAQLADVSIQGNNKLRLYVDRAMAVALDDYLTAEARDPSSTLSPSVSSIGRVGAKTYALGLLVSTPLIFYNLDILKSAGIDPSNLPTSWEGIVELARKIDDPATSTLGAYYTYDQQDWFWIALIESQGGRMMNADGTDVGFAGPEGLKAMQILKAFGEAGQAKVDMPRDQVRQLFAAGKLGILVDSSGSLDTFEKQAAGRFSIATRPFPLLSAEGRLPAGGALGIVFAQDPARQKAAWEFLKFAASAEGQMIIAKNSGYMVANSLVATTPDMLGDYFAGKPNMKPVVDQLGILDGWFAFPGSNGGEITKALIDHMRTVITLQVEPKAGLDAMVADVRKLLAK